MGGTGCFVYSDYSRKYQSNTVNLITFFSVSGLHLHSCFFSFFLLIVLTCCFITSGVYFIVKMTLIFKLRSLCLVGYLAISIRVGMISYRL